MSHDQFYQTVQLEQEWREEIEARRIDDANDVLLEIAARDEEFLEELEAKYPILKGWK